jgi:hypothetical protein
MLLFAMLLDIRSATRTPDEWYKDPSGQVFHIEPVTQIGKAGPLDVASYSLPAPRIWEEMEVQVERIAVRTLARDDDEEPARGSPPKLCEGSGDD